MMNNNTPLLEMRNIKKDFFGNQVLTDINFTLNAGEVLGLVGEMVPVKYIDETPLWHGCD